MESRAHPVAPLLEACQVRFHPRASQRAKQLPAYAAEERLRKTADRWQEIQDACSITVIAVQPDS